MAVKMSGEARLLEFFKEHFDGWEIYCQPFVNGKRPDFALLHPQIGLGIFEVKDWELRSKDWKEYPSAIAQARGYRQLFEPMFFARHNALLNFPVTVGLIFTRASNSDVHKHFHEYLDGTPYTTLAGRETLETVDIAQLFPLAIRRAPQRPTDEAANDLRSWLVEPHHSWEYRQPLDADPRQERFVTNAEGVKSRRMRGSAGSGKSVTLVRRAAKVAAEGKNVLFVCYNNALINYLRDTCDRTGDANATQIEWRTFHSHCRSLFAQFDLSQKFDELAKDSKNWDEAIPSCISERIASSEQEARKFHAIYIDEGQDFNLSWWNLLRRCLRDDGEMMIAFDSAQQIYPRTDWNTETLRGAGIPGRWIELGGSRRLPNLLMPLLRSFAEQFHPKALDCLPEKAAGMDCPCELRWVQVKPDKRVATSVRELARIIQRDAAPVSKAMSDLTFLSDRKDDCLEAETLLSKSGLAVTNSAHKEKALERKAKREFTMRKPTIKICTFQSFKGWQSRSVVISIAQFAGSEDSAAFYTMLTRVKAHNLGSDLTVVCSAPRLRKFGSTFPDFEARE